MTNGKDANESNVARTRRAVALTSFAGAVASIRIGCCLVAASVFIPAAASAQMLLESSPSEASSTRLHSQQGWQGPSGQTLLPPPPPPAPAAAQTEQRLQHAEHADSGRGLQFVWLTPEVGFSWASLGLLSNSDLVDGDVVSDQALGPVFGGGAGARLLYLTAGARFRYALLDEFNMWSLGAEVALRVPYGSFEPYVFVGGGYLQTLSFAAEDDVYALGDQIGDLSASGGFARLGGGADYFVTPVFSTGLRLEADFTFLSRDAVLESGAGVYSRDGSAVGLTASALLVLGLHF